MSLRILQAGLQTTVQDGGRCGFRQYGVPTSGAADMLAFRLGAMLVGNMNNEAALEIIPGGFATLVEADCLLALTGAVVQAFVNDIPVPLGRPVYVRMGSLFTIEHFDSGFRAYLSVVGGVAVPEVMASRSTYLNGRFGGMHGHSLQKGDVLPLGAVSVAARRRINSLKAGSNGAWKSVRWFVPSLLYRTQNASNERVITLPVIRGAAFNDFTPESRAAFFSQPFRVTPHADRMGIRFAQTREDSSVQLPALRLSTPHEMISSAVLPGTIQIPPHGAPVLLLADAQTVGGYPVIAHVCSVAMSRAAQLKPGDTVRFEEVSLEAAQHLLCEQEAVVRTLAHALCYCG